MIERYKDAGSFGLNFFWEDHYKYTCWLELELLHCKYNPKVPECVYERLYEKELNSCPYLERLVALSKKHEKVTHHEYTGFLFALEEVFGDDARWLHRGLTSSDVQDTTLALQLRSSLQRLEELAERVETSLLGKALAHHDTLCSARTHGQFAHATTLGVAFLGHAREFTRAKEELAVVRGKLGVSKLSGPSGLYTNTSRETEKRVLDEYDLQPESCSGQAVARDRYVALFAVCAQLAVAWERLATRVRLGAQSEVRELQEGVQSGETGSSAMPHKRNPVRSEKLCGLSRLVRSAVTPALENSALWGERDLSHSCVERVLFEQVLNATAYALTQTDVLVETLKVDRARCNSNVYQYCRETFLFSSDTEGLLLTLTGSGRSYSEAYRLVQSNDHNTLKELVGNQAQHEQSVLDRAKRNASELVLRELKALYSITPQSKNE